MGPDASQLPPTAARRLQTTFDTSTSAAVLAFQHWSHITAAGLVGDHTWNALVDDSGTSLEEAVGREHSLQDPPLNSPRRNTFDHGW